MDFQNKWLKLLFSQTTPAFDSGSVWSGRFFLVCVLCVTRLLSQGCCCHSSTLFFCLTKVYNIALERIMHRIKLASTLCLCETCCESDMKPSLYVLLLKITMFLSNVDQDLTCGTDTLWYRVVLRRYCYRDTGRLVTTGTPCNTMGRMLWCWFPGVCVRPRMCRLRTCKT